jgi:hypothetical protein
MSANSQAQLRLRHKKMQIVRDYRNSRGCQRCPETHPACLDLHHTNPEEKHPKLIDLKRGRTGGGAIWAKLSYPDLEAELAKCEVLCSNCHRKEETERQRI